MCGGWGNNISAQDLGNVILCTGSAALVVGAGSFSLQNAGHHKGTKVHNTLLLFNCSVFLRLNSIPKNSVRKVAAGVMLRPCCDLHLATDGPPGRCRLRQATRRRNRTAPGHDVSHFKFASTYVPLD
jgi:hypothetical protein